MSEHSGYDGIRQPNLYRTVTASQDLAAVSGAPKRNAAMLIFENNDATAGGQTAAFKSGSSDDTGATVSIPVDSVYPPLFGNFAATGAFSDVAVTCVAGWIDDGTVPLNA